MGLSIIIVSYNTKEYLKKCLSSIYSYLADLSPEVIVVDNSSNDGSTVMVKEVFPKVRLIENKDNRGFAAANNQGFKAAKSDYILLLNSDTELIDDSIKNILKLMAERSDVGLVGCRLLYGDRTPQPSCGPQLSFLTFLRQLVHGVERGRYYLSGYDREREVGWCTGTCIMARKKAIDKIGGFDENFFMYYEDNDLCVRLKKIGFKVIYSPKASIVHYKAKTREIVSAQEKERLVVENIKSYVYFYKKHFNILMQLVLRAILFSYYSLKLVVGSLLFFIGKRYPMRTYIKCVQASLK